MEYRNLPRGGQNERYSVLGLGLGGIQGCTDAEIERVIRTAIAHGVNFFDLCAGGKNVYAPFGHAIAGNRENVFFQLHLGAVYNEKGDYAWSRDLDTIRRTFEWELETLKTDYTDLCFLHCVDEDDDLDKLADAGIIDYMLQLKKDGIARHAGFSSHTPALANRLLDMQLFDMMMFSINPAYDFEHGDDYGVGAADARAMLFRRCVSEGVGISVMKPFFAGKLLEAETSPFGCALSRYACLQYALDRPAVLTVLPGVRGMDDLTQLLGFADAAPAERDYAAISTLAARSTAAGACVYCNHCQPCPAGIDIGLVNKYYDLALMGDALACAHYDKLSVHADACLECGHCDARCPFSVKQSARMREIAQYFAGAR